MCSYTSVKFFPTAWKCCLFWFLISMFPEIGVSGGPKEKSDNRNLIFSDTHVAATYINNYENSWYSYKDIKWPFQYLSHAWKYVKDSYGSLGANPLLAVEVTFFKDDADKDCFSAASDFDPKFPSPNKIFCDGGFPLTSVIDSEYLEYLITTFGDVIRNGANEIINNADDEVCGNNMRDILSYDVYYFLKDPTRLLLGWKAIKLRESYKGIFWFRDWFLPIYTNYGGVSVLRDFYTITFQHCPRNETEFVHKLNVGEFIHFWSEAAGADLSSLALKAFGNDSLQDELIQARKTFPFFDYIAQNCSQDHFTCENSICISSKWKCDGKADCASSNDESNCTKCAPSGFQCAHSDQGSCVHESVVCNFEVNCLDGSDEANCDEIWYPKSWIRFWDYRYKFELKQVYIDDDIVVYTELTSSDTSPIRFEILSLLWKYFKETSNVSFKNPRLLLVRHEKSRIPFSAEHHDHLPSLVFSNMIEYDEDIFSSVHGLNVFIMKFEVMSSPLTNTIDKLDYVCKYQTILLNTYFNYRNKNPDSTELLKRLRYGIVSYPVKMDPCVEEWLLPIYGTYGGSKTFIQFLNLTKLYWLSSNNASHYNNANVEFSVSKTVHFWSMAAGTDLEPLAKTTRALFTWNSKRKRELLLSRNFYPQLKYKVEAIVTEYDDNNAMFHVDSPPLNSPILYHYISRAWKHQKTVFGPFLNLTSVIPTVVMHSESENNTNCILSNTTQSNSEKLQIVDCHVWEHNMSKKEMEKYIDEVLIKMTQMSLKHHSTRYCPALHVSTCTMLDILMHDIYSAVKPTRPIAALKWQNNLQHDNNSNRKLGLTEWYWKIYNTYGRTRVLQSIFLILSEHWANKQNTNFEKQLNMGEFVHFWSGAAKVDLRETAKSSIGWEETNEAEFAQARKDFLVFNYICHQCDQMDEPNPHSTQNVNRKENDTVVNAVVGFFVFLLVVVLVGCGVKFKRDKERLRILSNRAENLTSEEITQFYEGNVSFNSKEAHAAIYALPFNREYEIPNERLVIDDDKILGSGEFGIVKMGLLKSEARSTDLSVAVKMVKSTTNISLFKAFLMEIKIMAYLRQHENITSLLATVTIDIKTSRVFAVMEFCAKGDLLRYIKCNSDHFVNLFKNKTGMHVNGNSIEQSTSLCTTLVEESEKKTFMSTLDLLVWSGQIANGMNYLGSKNVIHGDLAARNVLLTHSNIAKISDFGLSRQLVNYSIYKKQSNSPLPWRWLALESLDKMIFSHQSDIWAFGVTVWEIFTLGGLPYSGRTWNNEFVQDLISGQRLEKPNFGNEQIYMLLLNCMKEAPAERVSFLDIGVEVDRLKTHLIFNGSSNLKCV